jgi:tetratricopeptide (TPR) repeat protein
MATYHRTCAEQITTAGGLAAQHWGDVVVAYFGYPQAQEDDAERAIHAAIGLVEAMRRLPPEPGGALQIRIGIATGLVVVGDIIGAGDARVAGAALNMAARLKAFAAPSGIVITEDTRCLAGGAFEYRNLGEVALRGLPDPVHAWEVAGIRAVESRFEARLAAKLTPLVGRGEEMELLLRRWRQAAGGTGRVVLVSGEAGIGKSRLALELRKRLAAEPHATLRFFCSPHHVDSPLHPVVAPLTRAAGIGRAGVGEVTLETLASRLGFENAEDSDLLLLAELVSIPIGGRLPAASWSPQRRRRQTLEALLRRLERECRHRPVLVVFEDIHWIDPSSGELLDMMVERVAGLPALLIVTARPEVQPSWIGAAHASLLLLGRLGRRDTETLAALVADGPALPDDIVAAVAARSDGIPLFVEELTRTMLEAGASREAGDPMTSSHAITAPAVPATLQASLAARLDRLGPLANEVASTAAAIGREFSYELLAPVAAKSDADLCAALERLGEAGLVQSRGRPPDSTYQFKHALLRDAAYARLLSAARRSLHARIAATLEERFPDTAAQKPELLALQWTEAGAMSQAIGYWIKAGALSRAKGALVEAIAQGRKGLALLDGLDDGPERRREELDLQSILGWALFHWKGEGAPETGAAFARGRRLCEQLGDRSRLGTILYAQASHELARGELVAGRRTAEELLSVALERGDFGFAATAHEVIGRSLLWSGAYPSAVAHFEEALRDPPGAAQDPYRLAKDGRGISLSWLGSGLVLLRLNRSFAGIFWRGAAQQGQRASRLTRAAMRR